MPYHRIKKDQSSDIISLERRLMGLNIDDQQLVFLPEFPCTDLKKQELSNKCGDEDLPKMARNRDSKLSK